MSGHAGIISKRHSRFPVWCTFLTVYFDLLVLFICCSLCKLTAKLDVISVTANLLVAHFQQKRLWCYVSTMRLKNNLHADLKRCFSSRATTLTSYLSTRLPFVTQNNIGHCRLSYKLHMTLRLNPTISKTCPTHTGVHSELLHDELLKTFEIMIYYAIFERSLSSPLSTVYLHVVDKSIRFQNFGSQSLISTEFWCPNMRLYQASSVTAHYVRSLRST